MTFRIPSIEAFLPNVQFRPTPLDIVKINEPCSRFPYKRFRTPAIAAQNAMIVGQSCKSIRLRRLRDCGVTNPSWKVYFGSLSERKMRLAAATNNIEMIQRLLLTGVSPNNDDEQGRTPLHLASCRSVRCFSLFFHNRTAMSKNVNVNKTKNT